MVKKLSVPLLLLGLLVVTAPTLWAQDAVRDQVQRVVMPQRYLFFNDDIGVDEEQERQPIRRNQPSDNTMQQIGDIYEMYVQAVRAQINDDDLATERYLTESLEGIQQLLEEDPDISGNARFNELYRTVYTEYREFYGIEEAESQVHGEIFAVQRELFASDENAYVERYELPANISKERTEVPLVQNEYVNKHLNYFTVKRPEVMQRWLDRSEVYFPMMKRIFREEGVPTELVHLSMIESGLNPVAQSWASAVGMWQFIEATGSFYGLEVNWWMDERRDPEKATRAAARHLKDLYEVWGDWHLAIANYNISPRGLKRAIRAGGGEKDYWSALPHLPRETQGYIPGFIAVTMIDMNAESFGFTTPKSGQRYSYDLVNVDGLMPLDRLAEAANISKEKLQEYNPELLRWATPPGGEYPLKLPKGTRGAFVINYEKIPKNERGRGAVVHQVSRGETLGRIAQKYGTSVRAIYGSNEGLSSTIHPGDRIIVPLAPGSDTDIASSSPSNRAASSSSPSKSSSTSSSQSTERTQKASPSSSKSNSGLSRAKVSYTVKKGDTIGHIAEWYDVRASEIRAWNNSSNTIAVGERLTMYVPNEKQDFYNRIEGLSKSEKRQLEKDQRAGKDIFKTQEFKTQESAPRQKKTVEYRVKKNDTLIKIANSFGVSVQHIKKANNLRSSQIREGQRLRITHTN